MPLAWTPARRAGLGFSWREAVLVGGVAVCAVAAALVLHDRFVRRRTPEPARRPGVVWQWPTPETMPAATRPWDMATDPLAAVGMRPLDRLPPDLVAPPGAVRSYAFRRTLPDGVMDNLVCVVAADMDAVEAFYRAALGQRGFKLKKLGPTMRGDGRELLFLGSGKDCYGVSLRPADKGRKVRIALVVFRLGK